MIRTPKCNCPHVTSLFTLLGKKWVIFILQAVDEGADTFTEIRKNIGDANTKIVTDRLRDLLANGILEKSDTGTYSLSPLGKDLSTKLIDLADWWGSRK